MSRHVRFHPSIFKLLVVTILLGVGRVPAQQPREDVWLCVPAKNPDMSYLTQPNSDFVTLGVPFRTNENGFRDRPVFEKTEGVFRIICLGDSVTFGTGVSNEQTFPNVLEASLQGRAPRETTIDVLNAGVSAYNVRNIRALLEETVTQIKPDLVVYVFVENDLDDSVSVGPGGYLMALDPAKKPEEPFIADDFPAFWLMRREKEKEKGLFGKIAGLFDNQLNVVSEAPPPLLLGPHPETRKRWAFFEAELEKMKTLCDAQGTAFSVYSFGMRNHSELIVGHVRSICERMEIPNASTLPIFDYASYTKAYSLGYDPHCNPEGHRLMADRLLDFLRSEGLLSRLGLPAGEPRYRESLDPAVSARLEQKGLEAPRTIDLEDGKGALGLLGGVDPDGNMARYCLLRLSGPGDRIVVEAATLFDSPGQAQSLSAEVEDTPVGQPVVIERRSTQATFPIPSDYQNRTVEVKLIAQGPVDLPSPEERLHGKTPRTIRLMKVERM